MEELRETAANLLQSTDPNLRHQLLQRMRLLLWEADLRMLDTDLQRSLRTLPPKHFHFSLPVLQQCTVGTYRKETSAERRAANVRVDNITVDGSGVLSNGCSDITVAVYFDSGSSGTATRSALTNNAARDAHGDLCIDMRTGSYNIARCKRHSPPAFDCWSTQRLTLWQAQSIHGA